MTDRKSIRMGEAFDLQMGKTPSRDNPVYWGGTETWISIGDMGKAKYLSSSKEQITDTAIRETGIKLVPKKCVIMSFKLSLGKVAITLKPLYTNEAIMAFIIRKEFYSEISPEFFYYYLQGYKWESGNRAVMGQTLNKATISKGVFSYPPLPEQERIVAELDLLSGIIDKYKQQLKELDTLAQSIFYDMFGDPMVDEKGWETNTFDNLFRLKSGDGLTEKDFTGGDYPVYGGNGISGYHNSYNKTGEHIIVGRVGAYCGNARYIQGYFWLTDNAFDVSFDTALFDYCYVGYLLNTLNLHQYANHAAQPVISNVGLKGIRVIIPPLSFQQSFAEKIEAIEKQKESVKQAIKETETLFNSRMDYWFN